MEDEVPLTLVLRTVQIEKNKLRALKHDLFPRFEEDTG